jgi:hypothetical protein
MRNPGSVLAIGFAIVTVVAGIALAWGGTTAPHAGSVLTVLVPSGTVLNLSNFSRVTFEVPSAGAVITGAATVNGWVGLAALGADGASSIGCFFPPNDTSAHSVWSYSIDSSLDSGAWYWGVYCGPFGATNLTVTQPIELLYP